MLPNLPLSSPLHGVVRDHKWRYHKQYLVFRTPERVEDRVVQSAGERVLSV